MFNEIELGRWDKRGFLISYYCPLNTPPSHLILLTKLEKALRRQRKKERERSKDGRKKRGRKGEKGREVCDYFF